MRWLDFYQSESGWTGEPHDKLTHSSYTPILCKIEFDFCSLAHRCHHSIAQQCAFTRAGVNETARFVS
jgi:hypothetical protein